MTVPDPALMQIPASRIDQRVLRLFRLWTGFWFTASDPAPLGLLRLLVGGMLVYSHLVWGIDLEAFFGPDGWNSAEVIDEIHRGQAVYSFWSIVPIDSLHVIHQICIGFLVLFWIGFLTRITSIAALVIHVSYCQRAWMANYGLDQVAGILLLYLAIGPSGATYSVDSCIKRWWQSLQHPSRLGNVSAPRRYASATLAIRLIQVHYCVIYFFAATAKLQGEAWWRGHGLWRTISNYEYQSIDLTWLAWFPVILDLSTHIVLLWELSFAYLIWIRPLRPLMLTLGVLMHLGIGAFLGMWTFGLIMIFGYVAFLSPETVRRLAAWPLALVCCTSRRVGRPLQGHEYR